MQPKWGQSHRTVIVFVPEEEKLYPSSAYENAANCVRILASRHPIDCNDLSHIQEYYQLLYSQSEGDKQALRQAVEEETFWRSRMPTKSLKTPAFRWWFPARGKRSCIKR